MAKVNHNFRKLAAGYLFPEIARRAEQFQRANPNVKLHRLGIGNTTEALPEAIVAALHAKVEALAEVSTYTGYGDEQGDVALRQALVDYYRKRNVELEVDEIFISDGAKSDAANLQQLFAKDSVVAIQDPAYPVYVDSNVVAGRTGLFNSENGSYEQLVYLTSTAEEGFFPQPPTGKVDLIYLCSPNNPTGAVATHAQLQQYVDYCRQNDAVIIFDAAYSEFIVDPSLPRSIYEVPGATECAIEINSFSKFAGFTGVRLGWTIVPHALKVEDTKAGELHNFWYRRQCTFFNGASNISQAGGLAALSPVGLAQSQEIIAYYMENARIIRSALQRLNLTVYGGDNAPYLWVKTPQNLSSWEFFDLLLEQCHVIATPGAGFGSGGEGYLRISSFGHREAIIEAVASIEANLNQALEALHG